MATTSTAAPAAGRRLITAGLMLAMLVIAIEVTVVTTAMPTVIGELQGLELYPWVFSAYLLTATVTGPVFGKLADLYGRRPVFLGGLVVFLGGSVLCGFASSMVMLVASRALQGFGAGAVQPLVFTIIGDIYPLQQRGRVQGLLSLLWGSASLAGPALGAFLTLTLSWRWVFFVNIPFCLLAGLFVLWFLKERVERRAVSIDYAGAITVSLGLTLMLLTVLETERSIAWGSATMLLMLGASAVLFVLFLRAERRAVEPVLPLGLFRLPVFSISAVANLLQGAQLFALSAFIPLYVQGVRGENAAGSGLALTPLMLAWSVTGTFGPRMLLRLGFRTTAMLGTALQVLGALPLVWLDAATPTVVLLASMMLLGAGFGPCTSTFIVAVQSAVPWTLRGVATSSTQLFRSLGGTLGVALLGALLNSRLIHGSPEGEPNHAAILDAGAQAGLPPEAVDALRGALSDALEPVFLTIAVLSLLSFLLVAWQGRRVTVVEHP